MPTASSVPSYSAAPAADWIWNTPNAGNSTAPGTIYLRKTFTVTDPSTIASAVLRVNADDGQMTYVNGTLVANQPVAVNAWQTSKIIDIKSLLVPGTNVIAIAGIPDDGANSVIAAAQLDSTRIVTDATWKALPGTPATPPAGWNTAAFDDSSWPAADVTAAYGTGPWGNGIATVTAPTGVLRAQLIPPIEKTAVLQPVKTTVLAGDTLPVPSYSAAPAADWIWNTPNAGNSTAPGTIYLRKTFTVTDPSTIASAVLRVNADDGQMTYVNGTLVANQPVAVNAWQTSKIIDIKSLLVPGTNVIAIAGIPDDGANSVIAAAQLDSTRIVTDATWKALPGTPATPPAGWNTAAFDDSSWPAADVTAAYGTGPWASNDLPPSGPATVYDFGITTSGWARITFKGTAGTKVQISYAEKLNSDGTAQSEGNGSTGQTDTYILRGGGPETYEPKYGWKGYRYVQVATAPGVALPRIMSVNGVVVHTDLASSGGFTSSSSLLNDMHTAMVNTILNNQYSYGSDTPVYEKGGWTNDNGDYSTSAMANFDAESYYTHMMQNFDDSQDPAGNIGWLVPTQPGGDGIDPLWGGSFLLIEYNMYTSYNDLPVIRRDYSHLTAYINDMAGIIGQTGDIYQGTTFGDWSVPSNANPPSSQLLGSMFLYRETEDLAIMASAIGNASDASKYDALATDIRTAVNNEFYDAAAHQYRDPAGLNSHALGGPNGVITSTAYDQTANVIGLEYGLAPDADRQAIADGLAADVTAKGNHLATGANGSRYILQVLTRYGYGDLAYKVVTNPTAPGWGQWFLQCGATTMWEFWEDSSCSSSRSRDHAFMGTVDDWLYQNVAGITSTAPGGRTLSIDPSPVGDLTSASAHETTPLGLVSSHWTRSGTSFSLTVQVPAGARASVCVPAASAATVTESGRPVSSADGGVTGMQGSCLRLQVGAGTYTFHSTMS